MKFILVLVVLKEMRILRFLSELRREKMVCSKVLNIWMDDILWIKNRRNVVDPLRLSIDFFLLNLRLVSRLECFLMINHRDITKVRWLLLRWLSIFPGIVSRNILLHGLFNVLLIVSLRCIVSLLAIESKLLISRILPMVKALIQMLAAIDL